MPTASINYLSVIGSVIWAMLLGVLWYSPTLFGKEWMALAEIDSKELKKNKKSISQMNTTYLISVLSNLLMAYVLSHILYYVKAETISEGVITGFWMWLGFVATTMIINNLFQGKPIKLFLIDSFYQLFVLLGMSTIIVWWA